MLALRSQKAAVAGLANPPARGGVRPGWPLVALLAVIALCVAPASGRAAACSASHWVGAWTSAPSDASDSLTLPGLIDPSGHLKLPVDNETLRAILTPTFGGSTVRIHLSNRFGTGPAVFAHVTIALQGLGAALAGPATTVTFGGSESVVIAPGSDVVSDPVSITFQAMQTLAVSMYVANAAGAPTEHYAARQTSYFTPSGRGDHTTDTIASAFSGVTTDRDYIDGIDVLAPGSAGAVVAFGDSITDGYQGQGPLGIPEASSTLNTNGRWPDDLARRLIAAGIPLSVLNEGIGGDRVLSGGGPADASSGLSRLSADALHQSGVTTVIWLEGINDIGSAPTATAAELEAGWTQGVEEMHAAGLKVLQGTLTPSGGADGTYGTPATTRLRQQLNTWIRTQSPADGAIDFDAAVRDSTDTAIDPAYDDGDHLHLNSAGYQAMANAIPLSALRPARCGEARLKLSLSPRRAVAGERVTLTFEVTGSRRTPVRDATITVGDRPIRTRADGRATLAVRFTRSEVLRVQASAPGYVAATTTVDVRGVGGDKRSRRSL
jgi:lysophospholipase L1-like esterase